MKNFCYTPVKGIDDVIAEKINSTIEGDSWTPYRVATLRGIYDENESVPLSVEDLDKAAKEIIKYRATLAKRNIAKVNRVFSKQSSMSREFAKLHKQLKKAFNSEERFNRVSMIATMFSDTIDAIKEEYPELSREAICKGTKVGDTIVGGQSVIFSRVFNEIMSYQEEAIAEGDNEKAEKYKAVIDNWAALTSYARMRLRDTEGLKLGEKLQFVDETNADNYSEYVQSFDIEESKREAWQEENDKHSAFGSISKEVRKLLGSVTEYNEEGEMYDDLDFPIMLDPISAHQAISDLLVGVTSEKQMLEVLSSESQRRNWLTPIVEELKVNNRLRTQFYVDFHKGFQLYSQLGINKKKTKNGIIHWATTILNRESRSLVQQFLTRVKLGNTIDSSSIFDTEGNVDWENLKYFRDKVIEYLHEDKSKNISAVSKFWERGSNGRLKMSGNEQRQLIQELLTALGIPVDSKTMDNLMNYKNTKNLRKVIKLLDQIATYGIDYITLNKINEYAESHKSQSFTTFIGISNPTTDYNIKSSIEKLLKVIDSQGKSLRYERRARYKDTKGKTTSYDSYVNPSYMSDVFGAISNFVRNEDKAGLQKYIEQRFLTSSYFYDRSLQRGNAINPEGILNQWLKDLYTSTMDEDGFAVNFTFERFLGDDNDNPFENFTSKQHLISVMEMYFSDKQISSSSKYAHYPVFILGDSGVAKFIKAKRYSSQEILDGMYKVFLQERQRMKLAEAANEKLQKEGYKSIANFSKSANKYSILTFLNEEKYAKMIDPNHYEQSVKNAIKAYMADSVVEFKRQATALGILETKTIKEGNTEKTVYVNLNQNATPETIDKVLADFYWNYKFATINQLQFFTIDPSFYKGTKDLQKRYKEIHAPGTILSLQARDFDGNLYSETGIERCLYFEDIELPATDGFIAAIKANDKTRAHVGKYLKNTLTDGQGYRTLESYRKVRGMAGQWTEEHEAAYKAIKALRAKYGRNEQISNEDLAEIAKLAVVFQPIKPYMFTHEHLKVSANDEVLIPVQHKYAEAVLIPELLPNGLLKDMAYYMEDNDIDMVGSTTVVKVGNFGATDISKAKTAEELNEVLAKGYVHQLSYEDYRIQTNVPEHLNANQLFGTQLRKLIMANVIMSDPRYASYIGGRKVNLGDGRPTTLNGRNLIAFYNSLIVANILESYRKFESQAGDINALSDMLIQNIISNSRESMDNMLAYSLNEDGEFNIPLFEGELEHDSSATLFSIFKKAVNKQRIKGGSAVQVSALGIKGYEESGDLEYVVDPDNPNNILYAECEIPFDLSYTDSKGNIIPLKFEDWCNSDGTLILGDIVEPSSPEYRKYLSYKDSEGNVRKPKIEEKFPGILSFVAYRIPTERDYSMINMQIKRFIPKTAGGTIKVPVQGTTIAGFDFDVDKLYFMMREYVSTMESDEATDQLMEAIFGQQVMAFEEYDFNLSPLENTKAARNNMLIELIQQRLMDPETFSQRYTPGGFAGASKAARFIRELLFGDVRGLSSKGTSTLKASNVTKVISGGQTGVDTIGLQIARELGITTEGTAPRGYLRESGVDTEDIRSYGLKEITEEEQAEYTRLTGKRDPYTARTSKNVENSDGTVYFASDGDSAGRLATQREANRLGKPFLLNPTADQLREWLIANNIQTLNVAGNRGSKLTEEQTQNISNVLREALGVKDMSSTSTTSINFEELERRANDKSSDPEPNYDATDVMTLITYNQQNQVAGKLIGIFANQNTNHAFASLMKSFTLKAPIAFCGHSYQDLLNAPDGIDVDLNVAEFLAASVDAVKDPVLNFLNLNTLTADAGALLARIGYTTEEIGLLFNQPIIKEICEYAFNNQTTLEVAMSTVLEEYKGIARGASTSQNVETLLSKDSLAKNILNDRVLREKGELAKTRPSFSVGQLAVAELFAKIVQASGDVTRFVTSSKFTASNAVGSTFGDLYAQQMKVAKYLEDADKSKLAFTAEVTETIKTTISNDEGNLSMSDERYMMSLLYNPFGYEQAMYDMNRRVERMLSKYFPYNTSTYKEVRSLMASLTKGGTLDADTINSIHRDILAYMLAQREGSLFNGEQPVRVDGEVITAREYYTNRFAKRLYETIIAHPELKSYMILSDQFAEFITDEDTGAISLQITNVGSLQPYQKDAIKESWEELMNDHPNIARDLFIYNFYKTGFNFSPFAFMNLAPNSVKESIKAGGNITYIDFLREIQSGKVRINNDNFAKQYILNHLTNYRLVFYPKGNTLTTIKKLSKKGDVIQNSFDLDIAKLSEEEQKIWTIGKNEDKQLKFRPCIVIDGVVYLANGDGNTFNTSTSTSMTYRRAYAQGSTNKSLMFLSMTEKGKDLGIIEDMSFIGNTSMEPEVSTFEAFDRSKVIQEVAREFKAAYDAANIRDDAGELFSINAFIAMLEAQSDEVLIQEVEDIRKACRQNGILVLDAEGNLMQNC